MDEFLPYFRAALEQPGTVPPWSQWWAQHRNRAEDILDRPASSSSGMSLLH
jgi:hypothetical protein